ncbi:Fic family protein [Capsulimonas corticalis]|nr:Fic family protein [Capsulimonas corticalis]
MAQGNEKLAAAMEALQAVQKHGIVRSEDLSRRYRDRLVTAGFLTPIINGWLQVANPTAPSGSTASWFGAYWSFISQYLQARFGDEYCLSAEASIKKHVQSTIIPQQILVSVTSRINNTISLPHDTSITVFASPENISAQQKMKIDGVWTLSLAAAICKVSEPYYANNAEEMELALRMVRDPSELLEILLENGSTTKAGRLVGAYNFLGDTKTASRIKSAMVAAGHTIEEKNPFRRPEPMLSGRTRIVSPHIARLEGLWADMRDQVIEQFADYNIPLLSTAEYLADLEDRYAADAYNSLSIEGYRVTPELIQRVRDYGWNPEATPEDRMHQDALAAHGYYLAFQAVKQSIERILNGVEAAKVIDNDFHDWYTQMFSPQATAGIIKPAQLAGYRNNPVYLRGSMHVPPAAESVPDCMDTFIELMTAEENAAVQAVLGHFIFVFVHPYTDGNGRIGRFIMNAGFSSGGFPWTVIHQNRREEYLAALEEASVRRNITPFAQFVREEMESKRTGA